MFGCRWRVKVCSRPWGSWTCCLTTLRRTWHLNDTETCELCSNTKPLHHCVPFRGGKGTPCLHPVHNIYKYECLYQPTVVFVVQRLELYDFVPGTSCCLWMLMCHTLEYIKKMSYLLFLICVRCAFLVFINSFFYCETQIKTLQRTNLPDFLVQDVRWVLSCDSVLEWVNALITSWRRTPCKLNRLML